LTSTYKKRVLKKALENLEINSSVQSNSPCWFFFFFSQRRLVAGPILSGGDPTRSRTRPKQHASPDNPAFA